MKHNKIQLGQYLSKDGDWYEKYIINRIMDKTVDVTIIDINGSYEKCKRLYRYNKEALLDIINYLNAQFTAR